MSIVKGLVLKSGSAAIRFLIAGLFALVALGVCPIAYAQDDLVPAGGLGGLESQSSVELASAAETSTGRVTSLVQLSAAKVRYSGFSKFTTSFAVPGLRSTLVGGESCNVMTPQGICVARDYILISAYCNCEKNRSAEVHVKPGQKDPYHNSIIYVLDKSTGALRAVIQLPDKNHVGGIAFDGSVVWVAKSADKNLSTINYSVIQQAVKATKNPATDTYALKGYSGNTAKLKSTASFVQCFDGYVWVGLYSKDDDQAGMLYRYSFSGAAAGNPVLNAGETREYSLVGSVTGGPSGKFANGVAFAKVGEETRVIVNYSPGRSKGSVQALYSLGDSKLTYISQVTLPPMLETSAVDGSDVYSLFESAATPYMDRVSSGNDRCHYPIDTIQVKSVESTFGRPSGAKMADIDLYDASGKVVCKLSDLYGRGNVVCIVGRPTCWNTSSAVREAKAMLSDQRFDGCSFVVMDADDDAEAFYSGFDEYIGIDKDRLFFCAAPSSSSVSYNSWAWQMLSATSSLRSQSLDEGLGPQSALSAAESVTLPFVYMADKGGEVVSATTGPLDLEQAASEAFGIAGQTEGDDCALLDIRGSYVEAGEIDRILGMTNQEREKAGSGAVAWNANLEEAARARAAELAILYSHTRPDGGSVSDLGIDGMSAWAENIAAGYDTVAGVQRGWVDSPGHYGNMVDAGYASMGAAGFETEDHRFYWVELFSDDGAVRRDGEYPSGLSTQSVLTDISTISFQGSVEHVDRPDYQNGSDLLQSGDSVGLVLGESAAVTVFQSNGFDRTPLVPDMLLWSSSDDGVVSVDLDGGIVAKSVGKATITASCADLPSAAYELEIEVTKPTESESGTEQAPGFGTDTDKAAMLAAGEVPMHRLYNPWTGEHFYTSDEAERDNVAAAGWDYEGVGWTAPESGDPVYRLYNEWGGEHHYTPSADERDALLAAGWTDEGVGWLTAGEDGVPLYREYNPYMFSCNHNYTSDKDEHDGLVELGWVDEGVAWYGV